MGLIVFVCTGNMCRSPLAEAIASAGWDGPGDLLFTSAGTATFDGSPATRPAVQVGAELGLSLSAHRSRPVSAATVGDAAIVYGMTRSHVDSVRRTVPGIAARVELLDPDGNDIADPYGLSIEFYRQIRDEIAEAIEARKEEWAAVS